MLSPKSFSSEELRIHYRHLDFAKQVSAYSKDVSTKCGAVITDCNNSRLSHGWNRFPYRVEHLYEKRGYYDPIRRKEKLDRIVHAETDALLNCYNITTICNAYIFPCASCSECTKLLIHAGVRRIFIYNELYLPHWKESIGLGLQMLTDSGVEIIQLDRYSNGGG